MYATLQDMQDVFGQAELIKLTDRDRRGEIDQVVVGKSLARAASEIDSYIGGRYALPLTPSIVPEALRDRCCDIARYKLCGSGGVQLTDDIRLRYEDAIRYLEKVASGVIRLGPGEAGSARTNNAARFVSGGRQFGRDKTHGGAF